MTVINFYLQEFLQEEHHLKFIPFPPEVHLSYPFPFLFLFFWSFSFQNKGSTSVNEYKPFHIDNPSN